MDCSTWFLSEKQSKMTYPLPPRFSAREVLRCGCGWALGCDCACFFDVLNVGSAANCLSMRIVFFDSRWSGLLRQRGKTCFSWGCGVLLFSAFYYE